MVLDISDQNFGKDVSQQEFQQPQPYQNMEQPQQSQPQKTKGVIVFGSQKKNEPSPQLLQISSQLAETGRRIRILEDRYSNVRRKTQVTDQNMLSIQKNITREIKAIDSQIVELERNISQIDDKIRQVMREIGNFAKSEDLKVLKRYLDFWRPLSFITRTEAESLIKKILDEEKR